MTSRVRLPPELRDRLIQHALSSPRSEVCGLLGGNETGFTSVYPVRNIHKDPQRRFLMSPQEQIDTMRTMREKDETLAGIYHSHPFSEATPSATDIELSAYPGVYYFIVSLAETTTDVKCYLPEGNDFREIIISASTG